MFDKLIESIRPTKMSAEKAKALYAFGYHLYQQECYCEARATFTYLLIHAEFDSRALMGVGAAFQAENQLGAALDIYRLCIRAGLDSPQIRFHIAECLLLTGQKSTALQELYLIDDVPDGHNETGLLSEKVRGIIELIQLGNREKPRSIGEVN